MRYGKINNHQFILRFETGENLLEKLQEFCRLEEIDTAYFNGIGSVENLLLAHYLVSTKKYTEKKIEGVFELLSISGNISLFDSQPFIHAHVVLSDDKMHAYGGHLVSATVSATVEVQLSIIDSTLTKSFNEEIGLKLFDLPETT